MGNTPHYKQIKVYFQSHFAPFIIPYQTTDVRSTGTQLRERIALIALGIHKGEAVDWVLVPAFSPEGKPITRAEFIHGGCLPVLADTVIKSNGVYLLFWITDLWNAKELVKRGMELAAIDMKLGE